MTDKQLGDSPLWCSVFWGLKDKLTWILKASAIHYIHTLSPCLITHCVYFCHFLISIYISSSHSGNILERIDLQLCDALLLTFVYCTTLGWCSGMQNRRGRHTVEAISQTIPTILHLTQIFILNFTWCLCKHHPGKLAPSGTGGSLYMAEYRRHAYLIETSFILYKVIKWILYKNKVCQELWFCNTKQVRRHEGFFTEVLTQ